MAAFDITAKPASLSIKAGSTGTIMVVVSNRLGRPVMGLVQGTLTPATAAGWLVPPPPEQTQRRYEADPAATATLEFKIAVPKNAARQAAQFTAIACDAMLPDDTRAQGQPVAVDVIPAEERHKPPIPWWVWLAAAVVILGVGFGLYMVIRPKGVPDVVGKTPAEAIEKLTAAGFAHVTRIDTAGRQNKDTNKVVRQNPKAKSKLPPDSVRRTTPATIVVNRQATEVPPILGQEILPAIGQLQTAGLQVGANGGRYTPDRAQDDKIYSVTPAVGTKVPRGSTVDLVIYAYSDTPPCRNWRECIAVPAKPEWQPKVEVLKREQPIMRTGPAVVGP